MEKKKISPQTAGILGLIAVVFLIFTFLVPEFSYIKPKNINNIITDAVIPAIIAFGMGIIVAGGGFDLSLGHVASISALVTAYLMSGGIRMYPVPAIAAGLVFAAVIGLFTGVLVSRFGISSFIVTLGVQFLIIGVRQIITGGSSVYINSKSFKGLAASPLGISNLVFVLIAVMILTWLLMERSVWGRKIQFIGSNIEASRFKGIDVKNITMMTFVLGAVLAAFAGMLFSARAGAVQINSVDSKLLDAITIAVFSNVIFHKFKTYGIIMVAVLISMIGMGMSMLGIKAEWIEFVKGVILLVSIIMGKYSGVLTIKFRKGEV